jgi:hypothetical protein
VTAELTGQNILDILDNEENLTDTKGLTTYYVAYGLTVEFDPWGEDGKRVLSCKTSDGKEIDPEATYEVAYFNGSLPISVSETKQVASDDWNTCFISWLAEQGGTIAPPEMTLTLNYE